MTEVRGHPSPALVALGMRALADALTDQYPGLTFVPSETGTLPGASKDDRKSPEKQR